MSHPKNVDVVVVGGGVNGTGVARDCALRGLSVALLERNDIGFGASGNSTGMIHGGPRYLTKSPSVTYASCLDSGHIQRIAPHMLFRVPFLVTVPPGKKAKLQLSTYDGFFEVYDRYQHLKRGKKHLRFSPEQIGRLEPGLAATGGGVSFDEWGIDGVRLCLANLKDAVERGAYALVGATVTGLLRDGEGRVRGVQYRNRASGASGQIASRAVVNATGAWAPLTAARAALPRDAVRLRPGKGIHVFLDRRLSNFALITRAIDGREVFLLPWQNMSVLGTTDDDYYGDLDDVVATTDEVRYLVQAIERVFPAIRTARAIGTWGGVRPTLDEWGRPETQLSREHKIVDHAQDGADGFYSMLGGKLASYRMFAEEMSDLVAHRLGGDLSCQTHSLFLPGAQDVPSEQALSQQFGVERLVARRLLGRHGSRAVEVLELTRHAPRWRRMVCECESVTEAEIRYCSREEWATSVAGVARRTRLGLGPCAGMRCAASCGLLLAEETAQAASWGLTTAREFLSANLRRRLPVLGPEQARTEALAAAHLGAEIGFLPGCPGGNR